MPPLQLEARLQETAIRRRAAKVITINANYLAPAKWNGLCGLSSSLRGLFHHHSSPSTKLNLSEHFD